MTDTIAAFTAILGKAHVLTGADAARYGIDATGYYPCQPRAVLRPATTQEVSAVLSHANASGIAIVPAGGRTGLTGATHAEGAVMLSLERMNRIRDLRPAARVAVAEAGVILSTLHDRAAEHGLDFRSGSARAGRPLSGVLSTNAGDRTSCAMVIPARSAWGRGGSGRRAGAEPDGALHKDNSGYDLRDLLIGAEGTLAVITAATLKLVPAAKARATAVLGMKSLDDALMLLNRVQEASGGMVEGLRIHARHLSAATPRRAARPWAEPARYSPGLDPDRTGRDGAARHGRERRWQPALDRASDRSAGTDAGRRDHRRRGDRHIRRATPRDLGTARGRF
ncbi:MAG: FAD-binding oxidoreductase [Defluviimonas denitrificans]